VRALRFLLVAAGLILLAAGCGAEEPVPPANDADAVELPPSLENPSSPPDPDLLLPPLDGLGFTSGEITVVTLEPQAAGGETFLDHRYGDAGREPVEIASVEMLRVEAGPVPALAWTGPTFAVTFERSHELPEEWLEDRARATVEAVAEA
jgi:hypothetical protein